MLLPADAALARRDSALPGLATLLDADRLAQRIREQTGARVEHARLLYVRYKPGTNCLVGLQLQLHGRSVDAHAKTVRPSDSQKLDKTRLAATQQSGFFGIRLVLEPELIDVAIFPSDRRLPTLQAFGNEERRREILTRVLPDEPAMHSGRLGRLAYKPERRWVGRLVDARGCNAVLKVYTRTAFETVRASAARLPHVEGVQLPRLVGHSRRHGVLAFTWQEGAPLAATSPGSTADRAAHYAVGSALAALHAHRGTRLPPRPPEVEATLLLSAARDISVLCPQLDTTAFVLARELGQRLAEAPVKQRALHGDLHARQILLCADGRIALLDFDRAACGDPALDLGSLVAYWERDVASGMLPRAVLAARREVLLAGYAERAGATPGRVRLYTAAALFRITPELFRRRASNWPDDMKRALARCEALLRRLDSNSPRMLEAS